MKSSDSPFPLSWCGTSLVNVGLGDVRPLHGTYGGYDFSLLPSPPATLNDSFDWLICSELHDWSIANEKAEENRKSIEVLENSAGIQGLNLPPSFVTFFKSPELQRRIRSNTDCFLDLCPEAIPIPDGNGYLIRFLADSQGCVFWYLYFDLQPTDPAVVFSGYFIGTESEKWDEGETEFGELFFCAESFEVFLWQFWIENEIWFSEFDQTPMPEAGHAYIDQYLQNHTNSLEDTDDRP